MANSDSQRKRIKTSEQAHQRNKAIKSSVKTAIKKVHQAADADDFAAATEALRMASRTIDKAVSKGVLHKNNGANRKSGIAARVNKMTTRPDGPEPSTS